MIDQYVNLRTLDEHSLLDVYESNRRLRDYYRRVGLHSAAWHAMKMVTQAAIALNLNEAEAAARADTQLSLVPDDAA